MLDQNPAEWKEKKSAGLDWEGKKLTGLKAQV